MENDQPTGGSGNLKPFNWNKEIIVPLAILGAGVIIGLAIIYSSTGPKGGATDQAPLADNSSTKQEANVPQFKACLESGRMVARVQQDTQDAMASGGRGTPYSVVVDKNGKLFGFSGALPYENVKAIVDNALEGKAQAQKSDADNIAMRPISDSDHVFGNRNAPVKIVEFSDMECPFCKKFHATMQRVVADYDGRVAWVYRHFPLEQLHPKAPKEAEATECAAEQGGNDKFWAYLNRVMEITPSNNQLDPKELYAVAAQVGLK